MNDKVEDRGDDFTPTLDDDRVRDEHGRFMKKEEKTEADVEKAEGEDPEKKEEEAVEEPEKKEVVEEPEQAEEVDDEPEKAAEEEVVTDKTVPYSRFKEVIEQRKELQRQLEELQQTSKENKKEEKDVTKELEARLDTLYEKVEEARADGNTKEAARLQREIDTINREQTRAESVATAKREALVVSENKTYNQMLDYLEKARPVMNPDSEIFDSRVVAELDFQVKAYEAVGLSGPDALRRAAALIFEEDPFAPPKRAKEVEKKSEEEKPAAKRKVDVEKNLAAAKRTPEETERSERSDGKSFVPSKLSDEEFDKLPETKKRQLRGDEI